MLVKAIVETDGPSAIENVCASEGQAEGDGIFSTPSDTGGTWPWTFLGVCSGSLNSVYSSVCS